MFGGWKSEDTKPIHVDEFPGVGRPRGTVIWNQSGLTGKVRAEAQMAGGDSAPVGRLAEELVEQLKKRIAAEDTASLAAALQRVGALLQAEAEGKAAVDTVEIAASTAGEEAASEQCGALQLKLPQMNTESSAAQAAVSGENASDDSFNSAFSLPGAEELERLRMPPGAEQTRPGVFVVEGDGGVVEMTRSPKSPSPPLPALSDGPVGGTPAEMGLRQAAIAPEEVFQGPVVSALPETCHFSRPTARNAGEPLANFLLEDLKIGITAPCTDILGTTSRGTTLAKAPIEHPTMNGNLLDYIIHTPPWDMGWERNSSTFHALVQNTLGEQIDPTGVMAIISKMRVPVQSPMYAEWQNGDHVRKAVHLTGGVGHAHCTGFTLEVVGASATDLEVLEGLLLAANPGGVVTVSDADPTATRASDCFVLEESVLPVPLQELFQPRVAGKLLADVVEHMAQSGFPRKTDALTQAIHASTNESVVVSLLKWAVATEGWRRVPGIMEIKGSWLLEYWTEVIILELAEPEMIKDITGAAGVLDFGAQGLYWGELALVQGPTQGQESALDSVLAALSVSLTGALGQGPALLEDVALALATDHHWGQMQLGPQEELLVGDLQKMGRTSAAKAIQLLLKESEMADHRVLPIIAHTFNIEVAVWVQDFGNGAGFRMGTRWGSEGAQEMIHLLYQEAANTYVPLVPAQELWHQAQDRTHLLKCRVTTKPRNLDAPMTVQMHTPMAEEQHPTSTPSWGGTSMQGLQGTPTPTRGGTTTGKLVDRWVTVTKKGRHRPATTSPPSTDVRNFRTMQKLRNIAKLQNLPGRTMFLHMQTKPTDDMVGRITVSGTIGELQQVVDQHDAMFNMVLLPRKAQLKALEAAGLQFGKTAETEEFHMRRHQRKLLTAKKLLAAAQDPMNFCQYGPISAPTSHRNSPAASEAESVASLSGTDSEEDSTVEAAQQLRPSRAQRQADREARTRRHEARGSRQLRSAAAGGGAQQDSFLDTLTHQLEDLGNMRTTHKAMKTAASKTAAPKHDMKAATGDASAHDMKAAAGDTPAETGRVQAGLAEPEWSKALHEFQEKQGHVLTNHLETMQKHMETQLAAQIEAITRKTEALFSGQQTAQTDNRNVDHNADCTDFNSAVDRRAAQVVEIAQPAGNEGVEQTTPMSWGMSMAQLRNLSPSQQAEQHREKMMQAIMVQDTPSGVEETACAAGLGSHRILRHGGHTILSVEETQRAMKRIEPQLLGLAAANLKGDADATWHKALAQQVETLPTAERRRRETMISAGPTDVRMMGVAYTLGERVPTPCRLCGSCTETWPRRLAEIYLAGDGAHTEWTQGFVPQQHAVCSKCVGGELAESETGRTWDFLVLDWRSGQYRLPHAHEKDAATVTNTLRNTAESYASCWQHLPTYTQWERQTPYHSGSSTRNGNQSSSGRVASGTGDGGGGGDSDDDDEGRHPRRNDRGARGHGRGGGRAGRPGRGGRRGGRRDPDQPPSGSSSSDGDSEETRSDSERTQTDAGVDDMEVAAANADRLIARMSKSSSLDKNTREALHKTLSELSPLKETEVNGDLAPRYRAEALRVVQNQLQSWWGKNTQPISKFIRVVSIQHMAEHGILEIHLVPPRVGYFALGECILNHLLPTGSTLHTAFIQLKKDDPDVQDGVRAWGRTAEARVPWNRENSIESAIMCWLHSELMPGAEERETAATALEGAARSLFRRNASPKKNWERLEEIKATLQSIGYHSKLPIIERGNCVYRALPKPLKDRYRDNMNTNVTQAQPNVNLIDLGNLAEGTTVTQIKWVVNYLEDLYQQHRKEIGSATPKLAKPRLSDREAVQAIGEEDAEDSTEPCSGDDEPLCPVRPVGETGPKAHARGQQRWGKGAGQREGPGDKVLPRKQDASYFQLTDAEEEAILNALQANKRDSRGRGTTRMVGPCWNCGQMGHLQRDCPSATVENAVSKVLCRVEDMEQILEDEHLCQAVLGTDMQSVEEGQVPETVFRLMADLHAKADAVCTAHAGDRS